MNKIIYKYKFKNPILYNKNIQSDLYHIFILQLLCFYLSIAILSLTYQHFPIHFYNPQYSNSYSKYNITHLQLYNLQPHHFILIIISHTSIIYSFNFSLKYYIYRYISHYLFFFNYKSYEGFYHSHFHTYSHYYN